MRSMKRGIGFIPVVNPEPEKKIRVNIRDVEAEFRIILTDLEIEEEQQAKLIKIEKKIRKALAAIYKKIKKLRQKVDERNILWNRILGMANDFPKDALALLPKLQNMDEEIAPQSKILFDELRGHLQSEKAVVYKEVELSNAEFKYVRSLAITLNNILNDVVAPINRAIGQQEIASFERSVLAHNPQLK